MSFFSSYATPNVTFGIGGLLFEPFVYSSLASRVTFPQISMVSQDCRFGSFGSCVTPPFMIGLIIHHRRKSHRPCRTFLLLPACFRLLPFPLDGCWSLYFFLLGIISSIKFSAHGSFIEEVIVRCSSDSRSCRNRASHFSS